MVNINLRHLFISGARFEARAHSWNVNTLVAKTHTGEYFFRKSLAVEYSETAHSNMWAEMKIQNENIKPTATIVACVKPVPPPASQIKVISTSGRSIGEARA
jgi:hypothetical protein